MKIELLPESGNWYKVNMHCHTDVSDGKRSPLEVKEFYKKAGYSAVCFTDHEVLVDHRDLCDKDFVALHGYEICVKKDPTAHTAYFMPVYHFNVIAKSQDNMKMPNFYLTNPSCAGNSRKWIDEKAEYTSIIDHTEYRKEWLNEYLGGIAAGGFLITYNHPQWSLQTAFDYLGLEHLHAIEVINGGCRYLNDNTSLPFEQMLRSGMSVIPVGGDDNHSESSSLHAWTMIKAPELTYDALITALERGDCYASDGPDILSMVLEDGMIRVKTSRVASIILRSEGRYIEARHEPTHDLTEACFAFVPEKMGKFFRIELRDAEGNHAYSKAYSTADLIR